MDEVLQEVWIIACIFFVFLSIFSMIASFESIGKIESLCNRVAELEDAQEEKQ